MSGDAAPRIWRDIHADVDPDGSVAFAGYLAHLDGMPGGVPDLTRELVYISALTTLKATAPLAVHIARARAAGATREQIVQTVSIAAVLGGLPTLSAALAVVDAAFE